MKQVTQRLRDGQIEVADVPSPELRAEGVLVDVRASLLSAGTERTKVITGRQSLLGKARSRPDQARKVLDKARQDGLRETMDAVKIRLDQPGGLGYSSSGVVIAAGAKVRDLEAGDRVACAGADFALHADINYVPSNLCVRLADNVSFEQGAFTTVGSIAMHAVRQADVHLGERVAVVGLGLVGQLVGQILRAAGCFVVGVDLDAQLITRAHESNAVDCGFERAGLNRPTLPTEAAECDAIVITAATKSSDPVALATKLARDRAKVVIVGDIGLELDRADWYEKELDLRLSRSYGPGRYDKEYEERGLDYPLGYVRWTERRNMKAFVELMATRKIDVSRLISESINVDEAPAAYDRLAKTNASTLGVLLRYEPMDRPQVPAAEIDTQRSSRSARSTVVDPPTDTAGVIGAGSFAQRVLIPSLRDAGFALGTIASASGLSATAASKRFGFDHADTVDNVITEPRDGLIVIATRHASHANLAERALRAGKHVFVEKPPAITSDQLEQLRQVRDASGRTLTVGFNRRHAPLAGTMHAHLAARTEPMELLYRVNAGVLESDHWLNDLGDGGGRLIGEGCHFIDFACWMIGIPPSGVSCTMMAEASTPLAAAQRFTVSLSFSDGSVATILYGTEGAAGVGKEYIEAHSGGRTAILDDFRSVTLITGRKRKNMRVRSHDKGHRAQMVRMQAMLRQDEPQFEGDDPLQSMAVTFAAVSAAEMGEVIQPVCFSNLSAH